MIRVDGSPPRVKISFNHSSGAVVIGGFSIASTKVPKLTGRIAGAKAHHFPRRGSPHQWEMKSTDLISAIRRRTIAGTPGMHVLNSQLAALRAEGLTAKRTQTNHSWTNQIVVI